jgi:uncharacterized protein (TIGR02466 family)
MHVMELFPTPVFVVQTQALDNRQLSQQMYAVRDEEARAGHAKNLGRSNDGGYRSYDLMKHSGFDALKQFILATVNTHLAKGRWFAEPDITPDQMRAMWGVINGKGHSNGPHNHPHSWLSGVYYAKVPQDAARAGSLAFRDPIVARTFTRSFYRNVQSEVLMIAPEEGKMILFPSWCEHFVTSNQTDEDRIAFAFNIHPPVGF